jgi:hypothetical protein
MCSSCSAVEPARRVDGRLMACSLLGWTLLPLPLPIPAEADGPSAPEPQHAYTVPPPVPNYLRRGAFSIAEGDVIVPGHPSDGSQRERG